MRSRHKWKFEPVTTPDVVCKLKVTRFEPQKVKTLLMSDGMMMAATEGAQPVAKPAL
jgi:hypothetical protein